MNTSHGPSHATGGGGLFDISEMLSAADDVDDSVTTPERIRDVKQPRLTVAPEPPETVDHCNAANSSGIADEELQKERWCRLQTLIATAAKKAPLSNKDDVTRHSRRSRHFGRLSQSLAAPLTDGEQIAERREAIMKLGVCNDPRATGVLVAQLESVWDGIREAAAVALGTLSDREAAVPMVERLADRSSEVRRAAVAALENVGDKRAVRPLLALAAVEPNLRFQIAQTIVPLGDAALPALVEGLSDNDPGIVVQVLLVLSRFEQLDEGFDDERLVRGLTTLLDHPAGPVRASSAEALGKIGKQRAIGPLTRLLADTDDQVRAAAALALSRMPHPRSVRPLIDVLQTPSTSVRNNAARALGAIKDPRAVPALIRLLESKEESTLLAVAEALGNIGDAQAVSALLPMLKQHSVALRSKVVAALAKLKDPRIVPALFALKDDPQTPIRKRAVMALGQLRAASAISVLADALQSDRSNEVRAAAASALGSIGDKRSIPDLEAALRDESNVRCRAVMALGTIGNAASLPALFAMLKDPVPQVRYHAVSALVKVGDKRAIEPLAVLLDDDDATVRRVVELAMKHFGADVATRTAKTRRASRSIKQTLLRFVPSIVFIAMPDSRRMGLIAAAAMLCVAATFGTFWVQSAGGIARPVSRGNVLSVAFNSNADQLAIGWTSGRIEVCDVATGEPVVSSENGGCGGRLAFAGGEKLLAYVRFKSIDIWDLQSEPAPPNAFGATPHQKPIREFLASQNRNVAASLSGDGRIVFWDLATGKQNNNKFRLPVSLIQAFAISSDGKYFAGAGEQGRVAIYFTETQKVTRDFSANKRTISALAFSTDDTTIAAGTVNGEIHVWDTKTGQETISFQTVLKSRINVVRFRPEHNELATADQAGSAVLWNLKDAAARPLTGYSADQLNSLEFSDDGKLIALAGSENDKAWIVSANSGKLVLAVTFE